jgi:ankyrin repeat protein
LKKAAESGNLAAITYLVEQGANIHADDDYALRMSAHYGHLKVVKYLVEQGADIHAKDDEALRWSAENGHLKVVEDLVKLGANIHAQKDHALRLSAFNGHLEVVKYLVEQGADIHAKNEGALGECASRGHLECVKYLVGLGAVIRAEEDFALRKSARFGHLEVLKYLMERGARINACNHEALKESAREGHFKVVEYIVDHADDVNAEILKKAQTEAAIGRNSLVFRYLFEREMQARKEESITLVLKYGNLDMLKDLEDLFGRLDVADPRVLRTCVMHGNLEIVEYLVGQGADIDAVKTDGLIRNVQNSCLNIVAERGANVREPTNDEALVSFKMVKYLAERGADVRYNDDYALIWSAFCGHGKMVELLLEHGADIHAKNEEALRESAQQGHLDVVEYLLKDANVLAYVDSVGGLKSLERTLKNYDVFLAIKKAYQEKGRRCTRCRLTGHNRRTCSSQ